MPNEGESPTCYISISSPRTYSVQVPNGSYYIGAYMDVNDDSQFNNEPFGCAVNKTWWDTADIIDVSGSNVSNKHITLKTPVTVYVDDDFDQSTFGWGINHFNNIQDAVDAVDRNGTVYVYNGTYPESVVVTKTIKLTGNGSATIIDGMGQFGAIIAANNTKVSNINVTNCSGSPMQDNTTIGILIGNPSGPDNFPSPVYSVTLENTVFTNNLLPLMVIGYNHTINNNSFYNGSVYLTYTSNTTLQNNSFYGAENAIGIILIPVSNADFHHNVSISNQVNGHPVYYYEDETYVSVPKDAGEVITVGCNNFSIENMTYSLLVETLGTSKSVIANNTCSLLMAGCNGNDVSDNMVPKSFLFDGVCGFLIGGNSTRNNIIRNDFSCPGVSLALMDSSKYNNITLILHKLF